MSGKPVKTSEAEGAWRPAKPKKERNGETNINNRQYHQSMKIIEGNENENNVMAPANVAIMALKGES
jgi:hypothetical protein